MQLFNKEDVYDNEISPLMKKIIAICKEHEIPVIASFAYENDEENGIGCATTNIFFDDRKCENFSAAFKEIRSSNHSAMAITISS